MLCYRFRTTSTCAYDALVDAVSLEAGSTGKLRAVVTRIPTIVALRRSWDFALIHFCRDTHTN